MTAMSLIGAMLGARTDGDSGGRAAGDAGSSFGEALVAAGRVLDAAEGAGAVSAEPAGDDHDEETYARPADAAGAGADEADATSRAVLALAAQLLPVPGAPRPDGAEATTAQPGSGASAGDAATVDADAPVDAGSPQASAVVTAHTGSGSGADSAESIAPAGTSAHDVIEPVLADAAAASAPQSPQAASAASRSVQPAPAAPTAQVAAPVSTVQSPGDAQATGPLQTAALDGAERISGSSLSGVSGVPADAVGGGRLIVSESTERAQQAPPAPTTTSAAPMQTGVPSVAAASAPDTPAPAARAIATQVAPVVVNIAQRPTGTHQLTMTIAPDSLGPVTVRAHITAGGDVRVELSGATDAGRDALRGILTDLRRDLAAVMPHATLSVGHGTGPDANADRGGQQAAGGDAGDPGSGDRGANRGQAEHRSTSESASARPHVIRTTPLAAVGAGLDTFA